MRIGIDASRALVDNPTGTERYAFEVITRMLRLPEAKNHEWILYTKSASSRGAALWPEQSQNIVIKEIPLKYLWTQLGLAYRTWIDRLDVLWVPAHTLPVLRRPGIKTVVTIHGIEYEWLPAYENRLQRWYLPLSTQYAVKSATKVIAVSEFTKKQLIERLNGDEKKIEVILEGYDTQVLGHKSLPKQYNLKPREYLLFVGTVQPRKNLEKLIEAFSGLKGTEIQRFKLVIAGKLGWSYNKVLGAPEKFGVKDRVIFTGYVDEEIRQVLVEKALLYVQPSITEGFGLPVLEAMAVGVPVVSSSGGGLKEVVGDAGILFDPTDILEIRNSLGLVMNSTLVRKQLITKGKARMEKFSWEKTADKTLDLIVNIT